MATGSAFDDMLDERIRAHVRQKMVEHTLGLNAMARRLGVHKSYLSRVLNLERGPNPGLVARLHQKLGVSANVLLDEDPDDRRFFDEGVPAIPRRKRAKKTVPAAPEPSRTSHDSGAHAPRR